MITFVDMDGVIYDCLGQINRYFCGMDMSKFLIEWAKNHSNVWEIAQVLGISAKELWEKTEKFSPDFWKEMDTYAHTEEFLNTIASDGEYWGILSTPLYLDSGTSHKCIEGKMKALEILLGKEKAREHTLLGKSKYLCANRNTILIDDKNENVEQFRSWGGNAILYPRPWNTRSEVFLSFAEGDRWTDQSEINLGKFVIEEWRKIHL